MPQNKVNWPVFVYNDSHLSLKQQYIMMVRIRLGLCLVATTCISLYNICATLKVWI